MIEIRTDIEIDPGAVTGIGDMTQIVDMMIGTGMIRGRIVAAGMIGTGLVAVEAAGDTMMMIVDVTDVELLACDEWRGGEAWNSRVAQTVHRLHEALQEHCGENEQCMSAIHLTDRIPAIREQMPWAIR